MASWAEFAQADPELAAFGHARLHMHEDVFELDIERADSTTWVNWAKADTYAVRKKWVAS